MNNLLRLNKKNRKLWKLFKKGGFFPKEQFKRAVKQSRREHGFLTEIILKNASLPEDKTLLVLSDFFDLPVVLLRNKIIAAGTIKLIPKEISEQYKVIAFKKQKDVIHIATTTPENKQIVSFIKKKTGLKPKLYITTPSDISHAIRRYNSRFNEDIRSNTNSEIEEIIATDESAEKLAESVPIVRTIDGIIETAIINEASDIHFESNRDKVIVRFRIDGILKKISEFPKPISPLLVSRIKIMANLKIDEHMAPQDGRFQFKMHDQETAIRVSIIPTLYGPKIALRLLSMREKLFTLQKLGLNKVHYSLLKQEIYSSQGMILATGPTGSGKTTTLYTVLQMLNSEDVNICTIEDPIEYGIESINQMQIKPKVGLTFATGLKFLLRQDPNIIMVGEIRDAETATIAANSAMTGHLVLSTLHTNSAFLAPQRLIEMGLQGYLVSSVVNLVIGQRLIRKLCPHCKIKLRNPDKILEDFDKELEPKATMAKFKKLGLGSNLITLNNIELFRKRGCAKCNHTGYRGRLGIYEIIKIDDSLRKMILNNSSGADIKKHLLKQDVLTMAEDGLLKVFNGQTTFEEILRVTKE